MENEDPTKTKPKLSWFTRAATGTARAAGRPITFALAFLVVITWAVTGPAFHWSDTWQLVINTGTTIATFLMVFLIQNTQNRDAAAVQAKLDELIRVAPEGRDELLDLEDLEQTDIDSMHRIFVRLANRARNVAGSSSEEETPVRE